MANGEDYEWKFWFWVFVVSIAIFIIALVCEIFKIVGVFLGMGGILLAIYGLVEKEEDVAKVGVIAEFVGLFLLVLGGTVYKFLVNAGLMTFAQEVLRLITG